jgi:Fe2+ or Zn2+ uptake regulation protein
MPAPLAKVVTSRERDDCAICAIGTLTRATYEDVLRAVTLVDPIHAGKRGLKLAQVRKVLDLLGYRARIKRTFDVETATGLLWVALPRDPRADHLAAIINGQVAEVDGTIWNVKAFLAHRQGRADTLILVEES